VILANFGEGPLVKSMTDLTPFVYWAQTESDITLRVDIQLDTSSTDGESKNRRPPEVCIESEEIEVSAVGVGAQSGPSNYHFVLEFYHPVDAEKSSYQVRDNGIQITLVKKERDWWPRLIYQQHKLPWLKIDFDRWRDVDDETVSEEGTSGGGDDAAAGTAGKKDDPFAGMSTEDMIRNKYPDIYRDLEKDELGYVSESTKKVYLAAYNMFMTTGFLYVAAVLFIRLAKDDFEVVLEGNEAHENVGKVVDAPSDDYPGGLAPPLWLHLRLSGCQRGECGQEVGGAFCANRQRAQDAQKTSRLLPLRHLVGHGSCQVPLPAAPSIPSGIWTADLAQVHHMDPPGPSWLRLRGCDSPQRHPLL